MTTRRLRWLGGVAAMCALSPAAVAAGWRQYPAANAFSGSPVGIAIDPRGNPWVLTDALEIQRTSGPAVSVPGPSAPGAGVIASDAPGAVIVAWTGETADAGAVSVARHTGMGWADHVELERIMGPSTVKSPAIAAGTKRSVVAWLAIPPGAAAPVLRTAWRDAQQAWTSPTTVASQAVGPPIVGVDAAGNTLVVWRSTGGQIVSARLDAGGSTWSAPAVLSGEASAAAPTLAVGSAGDVVVAWPRSARPGVSAVTGRLPGPIGAPFMVSPHARRVGAAVGSDGRAAIVFADGRNLLVRTRDQRGRFAAARSIAPVPRSSLGAVPPGGYLPRIVINRAGMTAVWASDRISDGDWIDTSLLARRRVRGAWSRATSAGDISECCGGTTTIKSFGLAATGGGHIAAFVGDTYSDDRGLEFVQFDSYQLYVYSP